MDSQDITKPNRNLRVQNNRATRRNVFHLFVAYGVLFCFLFLLYFCASFLVDFGQVVSLLSKGLPLTLNSYGANTDRSTHNHTVLVFWALYGVYVALDSGFRLWLVAGGDRLEKRIRK